MVAVKFRNIPNYTTDMFIDDYLLDVESMETYEDEEAIKYAKFLYKFMNTETNVIWSSSP